MLEVTPLALARRYVALARRYVRAFGPRHGLPMFAALHAPGSGVVSVVLPGIEAPLAVRRGTADVDVLGQIFIDREYALSHLPQWKAIEMQYRAICERGKRPLIVDCGAHVGLASVFFHHLCPRAQIVAIEPAPSNFDLLAQNSRAYPSITPVRAAVSDRREAVRIANPDADTWAFSVEAVHEGSPSPPGAPPAMTTVTIDEIAGQVAEAELLIVKVDIEGAEEQLFRGNLAWLARTPLLIIEIHDWMKPWSGSSRNLWRAVATLDADVCLRGENVLVFNRALLGVSPG